MLVNHDRFHATEKVNPRFVKVLMNNVNTGTAYC
jgi:hypothetical protein